MINIDVIEKEIRELEARGDTTYSQCERLAWLYVVRDHLLSSSSSEPITSHMRGSEFLEVCSGVNYPDLIRILDEHMSALKVVQPREYQSVMDKIRYLHR